MTRAQARPDHLTGTPGPSPSERSLPLGDFDYALPVEQIAQQPMAERDQSRLLVMDRDNGRIIAHDRFANIVDFLNPGDLLVLNETKVSALRLYGAMAGGGRAEFLLTHRIQEGEWQCLAKPGKRLRPGAKIEVEGGLTIEITAVVDERGARLISIQKDGSTGGTDALVDKSGTTPLPPYIHSDDPNKFRERYQTVYACYPGSAAAPTAGLHFTPQLLQRLAMRGIETAKVTLHVGIGTFRPIESADIREHSMHEEQGEIPEETARKVRLARGRIIAVGTTSVRALESAAVGRRELSPGKFSTSLYITPGYQFQVVDALITNFHMPRSTLLVLVAAFAGRENILNAYREALQKGYRLLSFGDSMLIVNPNESGMTKGGLDYAA